MCSSNKEIKKQINIPLVADIHFDYRLAIAAMENGADKIRINPGNIGSVEKVKAVVDVAKERNIPIRVGVNSGSLEKHILEKYGKGLVSLALAESYLEKGKDIFEIFSNTEKGRMDAERGGHAGTGFCRNRNPCMAVCFEK